MKAGLDYETIWNSLILIRQSTCWQAAHREGVVNTVAGLSVTPTLQAGVFLLRRLQHVVTA